MQVHVSGGVEWFSKERFEDLVHWLFLTALVEPTGAPFDKRTAALELTRIHETSSAIIDSAGEAGYRVAVLLAVDDGQK